MARVARGRAAVAGHEEGAGRPDAEVQGGVSAVGEDKALVGAHEFGLGMGSKGTAGVFSLEARSFLLCGRCVLGVCCNGLGGG